LIPNIPPDIPGLRTVPLTPNDPEPVEFDVVPNPVAAPFKVIVPLMTRFPLRLSLLPTRCVIAWSVYELVKTGACTGVEGRTEIGG